MKILVTGRGGAASWIVRGEQIGNAMGARVKANATLADCKAADVILLVKRPTDDLIRNISDSGRPWVYDIVDAFPQKQCGDWSANQSKIWLRDWINLLNPQQVIFPNARMRMDSPRQDGAVIYHHAMPGQPINPIRREFKVVGFQGHPRYLGDWLPLITQICSRHNWDFLINPPHLADLDAVLAVRAHPWNSYAAHNWKSNIKLANAHATGTPFFGPAECGYLETATGWEYFNNSPQVLENTLLELTDQARRQLIQEKFLEATITLKTAADQTLEVLYGVV